MGYWAEMDENIKCEFGTTGNVRFLESSDVKTCDSDGNELDLRCKCGDKAAIHCYGVDEASHYCFKCAYPNRRTGDQA